MRVRKIIRESGQNWFTPACAMRGSVDSLLFRGTSVDFLASFRKARYVPGLTANAAIYSDCDSLFQSILW